MRIKNLENIFILLGNDQKVIEKKNPDKHPSVCTESVAAVILEGFPQCVGGRETVRELSAYEKQA